MSKSDDELKPDQTQLTVTRERHISSESLSDRTLLKVKKVRKRRSGRKSPDETTSGATTDLPVEEPAPPPPVSSDTSDKSIDDAEVDNDSPSPDAPEPIVRVKKKRRKRSGSKTETQSSGSTSPQLKIAEKSRFTRTKWVLASSLTALALMFLAIIIVYYSVRVSPVSMASSPLNFDKLEPTTLVSSEEALNAALQKAKPGDQIAIAPGTYTDWQVTVPASVSGSASEPIVIMPDAENAVIMRGDNRFAIQGDYVVVHGLTFEDDSRSGDGDSFVTIGLFGDHNRVTGNRFVRLGDDTSPWKSGVFASASARYAQIDHNTFVSTASIAVSIEVIEPSWRYWRDSRSPYVHHNDFEGTSFSDRIGQQFRIGIQLGQDEKSVAERDVDARIEHNIFRNFDGLASIESKNSGADIRYNRIYDSASVLLVRAGRRNTIEGNVLIRTAGGIALAGSEHRVVNNYIREPMDRAGLQFYHGGTSADTGVVYEATQDSVIAHNTILHLNPNAVPSVRFYNWLDSIDSTARGNRIVGNIFVHRDANGAFVDSSHRQTHPLEDIIRQNRIEANLLWRLDSSPVIDFNAHLRAVDSYRVKQIIADPKLDLRIEDQALLREDSPAIDKGATQTTSYDLLQRQRVDRPDIGAFEWRCEETFRNDCTQK